MSVIAAKISNDNITITADSIILKDDLKRTDFSKLRVFNGMIVGGCGSAEELELFFSFASNATPNGTSTFDIQRYLKGFSLHKEEYTGDPKIENCYIIAIEGSLFETDGMFVREVKDYTAIGEGEPYAVAALHLGHNTEEAVVCAADLCCNVSLPYVTYFMNKKLEESPIEVSE